MSESKLEYRMVVDRRDEVSEAFTKLQAYNPAAAEMLITVTCALVARYEAGEIKLPAYMVRNIAALHEALCIVEELEEALADLSCISLFAGRDEFAKA